MLYSFRDLVAARTVARLRAVTSLQRIIRSIRTLEEQELTSHLSEHRFSYDGKSIKIWVDEELIDVDEHPGQFEMYTFADIYKPFQNLQGRQVPDLLEPATGITVDPHILGGAPSVRGSRVSYDMLVGLSDEINTDEELEDYYPFLSMSDVRNAESFSSELEAFA